MSGLSKRLAKLEMDNASNGGALDLASWAGTGEYIQVIAPDGKPISRKNGEGEAVFLQRAQDQVAEAVGRTGARMPGILWTIRDGHDVLQPYPPPRPSISREEWVERFGNSGGGAA